jgi:hypothetical protein
MDNLAQGLEQTSTQGTGDLTTTESRSESSKSDERMFRQSELNEIVGRAKHDAVESYKRRQEQQVQSETQSQNINSDNYRRIAAEEAQRLRDEWMNEARQKTEAEYAQKLVDTYFNKVESDKSKYEDFDQVTNNMEIGQFPNVVHLLAEAVDNAGDLVYHFGKNRLGLVTLEALAEKSPKDALEYVKSLSQSIKDNEQASKAKTANSPLSQLRPSNYGTDSGAPLSVSDYRKKWKV